jgi:mannitol/fructose-specific phosphotransferase system IIA component (Ntr-type)/transcriptional regulator with XRE-family HTH domain
MGFGYILRTLRISAGFGLRQFSRTIGLSPTYLSLVENGKLPPPTPARIAQIEQALNVPAGHLLSIAHGLAPDLCAFIAEVPEAAALLGATRQETMAAADFMQLTAFLNTHGWPALREAMQSVEAGRRDAVFTQAKSPAAGTYVYPFLKEGLIFNIDGGKDKTEFLAETVARIAASCRGLKADALLRELIDREEASSTGIGSGVAIPHAYAPCLDRMIVALARIPEGMEYDAVDGKPVQVALVLAGPKSADNLHVKLLAEIAKLVDRDEFCESVLEAPSPRDVISLFRSAETGTAYGGMWRPMGVGAETLQAP